MRSKYIKYWWILILPIMIVGLGWVGWTYKNNITQAKQLQEKAEQGTTVKYEEGEITKSDFGSGKDYTNKLLPKLLIKAPNSSWKVSEDDRSGDNKLNLITQLRNSEDTLVLSAYSNNGGLEVGASCFGQDDLLDLNNGWIREKLLNETGSDQIGFVYLRKDRYAYTTSQDFEKTYSTYVAYHNENNLPIIPKNKVIACGTAPRVNITTTTKKTGAEQTKEFGTALLRISINDAKITTERLKSMDDLVSKIQF